MFGKSDKSQSNVTLMSKRNLEENDKNRVNYRNNNNINNNWLQNNNNNKRVKTDNLWTPLQSNCLQTTNPSVKNTTDNMDEEEEAFNDGYDDILSQAADNYNTQYVSNHSSVVNNTQLNGRTSDQNMSSQTTTTTLVKSIDDVNMGTNSDPSHQSSNSSSEASEGRLKILESRNKKLDDEVFKYKTQSIQMQHKIKELEAENISKISEMTHSFEGRLSFEKNEKTQQMSLLFELQKTLRQYAPNAPILQLSSDFLKQRKIASLQDFSQTKLQEFYAPLSYTSGSASLSYSTQYTPANTGDVLAEESQTSIGGKRPKLMGSFPSQISATQSLSADCSMNSMPQPMDTGSDPSSEQTTRETDSSQTQSLKMLWNPIRAVLEHKFCSDQKHLNQFFMETAKEFDDHWVRNNQEINDWTIGLTELSEQLHFKTKPLPNF